MCNCAARRGADHGVYKGLVDVGVRGDGEIWDDDVVERIDRLFELVCFTQNLYV